MKQRPGERAGPGSSGLPHGEQKESYFSRLEGQGENECRSKKVCRAVGCLRSLVDPFCLGGSVHPVSNSYSVDTISFSISNYQFLHKFILPYIL